MTHYFGQGSRLLALTFFCMIGVCRGVEVKAVAWSPHGSGADCRMNMGPTGAQAWMRGYQFQVMAVDAGSPAEGVLRPGDLVVGADGATFSSAADSRMTLGNAIGKAEATDGGLRLAIQRDGLAQQVTVKLAVLGTFAPTWPYGCAKSQRVLHEACEYLLESQLPSGELVADGGMGTFLTGLLLLSSGEARFMDGARRAVYATMAMDLEGMDYHNWAHGYGGVLLAEYYLATGDTNVLAKLKAITDHLAYGQMRCGSWGHSGPSAGYGAMNQAGIICAMAMVLAQECGVDVDRASLNRALSFYGRNAELGAVPYGDHMPNTRLPDDNGKNASTAILCSLRPEWQGAATTFAQSVASSYALREEGHTGGFFSMVWGPLGCSLAGEAQLRTFLDYQAWYYNLCRTWRGALVHLPYFEALTRFDSSSYVDDGGGFTAGGLALVFALPHHKLRILGAPASVFAAGISGPLLEARQYYQTRQWKEFDAAVARMRSAAGGQDARGLGQLEAAADLLRASVRRTRLEIENNLAEGDAARAVEQYQALKRMLGENDDTVVALAPRLADATVQWHARAGVQYYKAWKDLRSVAVMSWLPYGGMAKADMEEVHRLRPPLWETLVPVCGTNVPDWCRGNTSNAVSASRTFELGALDFASLRVQIRSPRNAYTRVQLNGVLVADVMRGQRSGYAKLALDESARSLLRVGTNALTFSSTSVGTGGNALDVGLDGVRQERPLAMTPVWQECLLTNAPAPEVLKAAFAQAGKVFQSLPNTHAPDPAVPERMCVRDSQERFQVALEAACDALSTPTLQEALHSPVPYWRSLAGQALVRRGAAGVQFAAAGLNDADWRTRSACCDVLGLVGEAAKGKSNTAEAHKPVERAVREKLAALLTDENAWVRCRAAAALGSLGKMEPAIAAALARAIMDSNAWVRAVALGSLEKATDDPKMLVNGAAGALQMPSTNFGQLGKSLALLQKYGADDQTLIPALVFALTHPGEGEGSQSLANAMKMLVKLDAKGATAVPTLATVAAGGYAYDRLRGDPRKAAIELLGEMGPRAIEVVPALKTIVAGTDEKQKELRVAAQAALSLIEAK